MSNEMLDRCLEFIKQQIIEQKLEYAQHTEEFSAALLIGLEAGIKQAKGDFDINIEVKKEDTDDDSNTESSKKELICLK